MEDLIRITNTFLSRIYKGLTIQLLKIVQHSAWNPSSQLQCIQPPTMQYNCMDPLTHTHTPVGVGVGAVCDCQYIRRDDRGWNRRSFSLCTRLKTSSSSWTWKGSSPSWPWPPWPRACPWTTTITRGRAAPWASSRPVQTWLDKAWEPWDRRPPPPSAWPPRQSRSSSWDWENVRSFFWEIYLNGYI